MILPRIARIGADWMLHKLRKNPQSNPIKPGIHHKARSHKKIRLNPIKHSLRVPTFVSLCLRGATASFSPSGSSSASFFIKF